MLLVTDGGKMAMAVHKMSKTINLFKIFQIENIVWLGTMTNVPLF